MTPEFTAKFWTYWFISLGGVGLFAILVTHYDDIWEFITGIFDAFRPDDLDEFDDDDSLYLWEKLQIRPLGYYEKHKKKKQQWRRAIRSVNRRRKNMEGRLFDNYRTGKRCLDVAAETLTTHQEMLEEMYKEAPTARTIKRNIRKQHR